MVLQAIDDAPSSQSDRDLPQLAIRMLAEIGSHPKGVTQAALGKAMGVKPGSGRWYAGLRALEEAGRIVRDGEEIRSI